MPWANAFANISKILTGFRHGGLTPHNPSGQDHAGLTQVHEAESLTARGVWVTLARLLGEIAMETHPVHAGSHFEKSIGLCQQIKTENELAMAYAGYGRFYREQGNISQAREYLIKAHGIFERLGTLIEPDKVKEELGELSENGL